MAEWWEDSGVDFSVLGGDSIPWWDYDSGIDPNAFNFDFGNLDFSFDPSIFNFDPSVFAPPPPPQFISDPFAIPTGDLNLPNIDLSNALAKGPTTFNLDFNPSLNGMGQYDFGLTDTDTFGVQPTLSAATLALQNQGGSLGFNPYADMTGDTPFGPPSFNTFSNDQLDQAASELVSPFPQQAQRTGLSADEWRAEQASNMKWQNLLGLGQLGLGLGGGLMGAFSKPPQRTLTPEEKQKLADDTALAKAKLDLEREQMQMQAELGAMQAEVAERHPLFESDPRFSALYNDVTKQQQGLSPDNPEIQAMTQQIYSVRQQAAQAEYARQRDAIMERANRLGTNPAAELAQINEAEQKAMQALFVEAQQAALAFATSRIDPANQLLQSILKTVV